MCDSNFEIIKGLLHPILNLPKDYFIQVQWISQVQLGLPVSLMDALAFAITPFFPSHHDHQYHHDFFIKKRKEQCLRYCNGKKYLI